MNTPVQLIRLLRFWGIDRAIAYTIFARGWTVIAGPLTLLLVATFLTPEQQGFYYTFGSILALQIFFDLGVSYVIFQFASHEKARLDWTRGGTLEGEALAKGRLSSLLRAALLWYSVMAILVAISLIPAGLYFFNSQPLAGQVLWQLPWVWVVLISATSLFASPLFAVLEGCGLITEIALLRLFQGIAGNVLAWSTLALGGSLYSVPVYATTALVVGLGWLARYKWAALLDLLKRPPDGLKIDWWREVWPFQWKIALTGICAYFVFVLFNPVLFRYHGPVVAGQMGMSITMTNALSSTAIAWISTKMAPFGVLIANRDYKQLDRLFFPAMWQSFVLIIAGGVAFWSVAFYLHVIKHPLSLRLLPPLPLGLLVATALVYHLIGAEAIYLRSHKQEPFLWHSLINGCLIGLSTYFLGRSFGATGMMAGYFGVTLLAGLGLGTWIFIRKRRAWHGETEA